MPAYNFLPEFVPAIEAGTKRQTVRRPRKNSTQVGSQLFLYTQQRSRHARLLRPEHTDLCRDKKEIKVVGKAIILDGETLTDEEIDHFIRDDTAGLWGRDKWFGFIKNNYGSPFKGEVIYW